jgi:hypothetical protein
MKRDLATQIPLADVCVYTTISPDKLAEAVRNKKPLLETKRWVSALRYIKQARTEGRRLPVVFADSRNCTRLIAWGTLKQIVVRADSTKFTLAGLYDLGSAKRRNLVVLTTRAPIPVGHVRPYVLCKTPPFLAALAKRPNPWSTPSPTASFWIVKGRPSRNDFEGSLKVGVHERWYTRRPPTNWSKGDRLFFWRAAPTLDVAGLGEFLGVAPGTTRAGESIFEVRHLTPLLDKPVGIEKLRSDPLLRVASFLKSGPSGTMFPLTAKQGRRLYELVCRQNPVALDLWRDLDISEWRVPDVDMLDVSGLEGARRLVAHLQVERDRGLVEKKKRAVLRARGKLACEVCHFDFAKHYGRLGEGFCEVHHRSALSKTDGECVTKLEDLAILCSNCHRMLHRRGDVISIEKLRKILTSPFLFVR